MKDFMYDLETLLMVLGLAVIGVAVVLIISMVGK